MEPDPNQGLDPNPDFADPDPILDPDRDVKNPTYVCMYVCKKSQKV